jgi:hypothetical protein
MINDTTAGIPLILKNQWYACLLFNIGRKRVAQKTNSLHTESMPLVMGEGQQPDKHYQIKTKVSDSICPVVEISFLAGNKGLRYKNLCHAYYYNTLSKAA